MAEKTFGKEIPQVGSKRNFGESHSSQEDCPMDSGEGKQPLDAATVWTVGDQAILSENMTGRQITEDHENPFKRRDSIPRSPPSMRRDMSDIGRIRSNSLSVISNQHTESQINKRKREEVYFSSQNVEKLGGVLDLVKKLTAESLALQDEISISYNPKKKLKELSKSVALLVKQLERKIESELSKTTEEQNQLVSENGKLQKQLHDMTIKYHEALDSTKRSPGSIQCKECVRIQQIMTRRQELIKEESYDNFKQVTENDWKDEIFPKIQIQKGNLWDAPSDYTIALPCSVNIKSSDTTTDKAITRFGGREELRKQNKQESEVATMVHSMGFPDEDGNYTPMVRRFFYPIISNNDENKDIDEHNIFTALKTIKTKMISHKLNKLIVPKLGGVIGLTIIRMAEYLFVDTNIEVIVYTTDVRQTKTKTKNDALLLHVEGKTYADLLKTVKTSVDPKEIGVEINEVKQTRGGELLLTIRNGTEKLKDLERQIKQKIPSAVSSILRRNRKVLHIQDLDATVNEEEVGRAITEAISVKTETFQVKALRPAYGNQQKVTIIMEEADAKKLIELGKIKIGWTKCRISERRQEGKCYRCWQVGHIRADCKGPDRGELCLKCGKEGHKAAACQNNAFCIFCDQEGHQSGSTKCPRRNKKELRLSEASTNNNV